MNFQIERILLLCWWVLFPSPSSLSYAFTLHKHGSILSSRLSLSRSQHFRRHSSLRVSYTDQMTNSSTTATATANPYIQQLYPKSAKEENFDTPELEALQTRQLESLITTVLPKENDGLSDVWKARLLLIGASALYGTNFSLVKILGDTMPVGVSTSLRFGFAVLATLPWLLKDLEKEGALMAAWLGFEVGLWNSIGYVAQAVGLETTPASESAFICSLAVVTVPLLDFISGKKLLHRQWIGAILAVVGVAILELGGDLTSSSSSMTTGDMLSLIQPFAFGVGFWRMEQAMHRFPHEARRLTAAQLLAVFFASVGYGFWAIDVPTLQSFPWAEWLTEPSLLFSLFWTGCITTALTIYMENLALETLSAAETTLIFSTEPLWGTAFAAVVMGEQLGFGAAIGGCCILSACIYSNLGLNGLQELLAKTGETNSAAAGTGRRHQVNLKDLPREIQRQWLWFASSVATSWSSWTVAAESSELEPDFPNALGMMLKEITNKLPF